jgi:cell division protease FtsH
MVKNLILWVVIALVLLSVFSNFGSNYSQPKKLEYSEFYTKLQSKDIKQATIEDRTIQGITNSGESFSTYAPDRVDLETINKWIASYDVEIHGKQPEKQNLLMHIIISWFPMILIFGLWIFFMRQMQGGGGRGGAMSFGKSRARFSNGDQIKVTFKDVAGIDEAKHEVVELVDFLKDPTKFHNLGGKIPSGVLMVGQPGTGKTLLAKAIAGEAKVPFFSISGSDFVEMFVGVGASRVRDMFEQAKKHAPCIIFIDEIDAVGRHRGVGVGGGHDEREQTLNQLLVEMDGFEGSEGVIVIAATNRPDVLDKALLRPGRFDRQVIVPLPDIRGREQILQVHIAKVPAATDVQIRNLARGTPGFSGADLANLVNEAALFAARESCRTVNMSHLEKAKDKIIMGVERRSMVMSEDEKINTAYHESGHTIVGLLVPAGHPVYKVSIIPRGQALGVTMFLPERDQFSNSREQLESRLATLFGGRIAEDLIFGKDKVTTGASDDIKRATSICRDMVTKWGLSDKMGPLTYFSDDTDMYGSPTGKDFSESTSQQIDEEVKVICDRTYNHAKQLLENNLGILHNMAKALLKYETLEESQIKEIMQGLVVSEPKGWNDAADKKMQDDNPEGGVLNSVLHPSDSPELNDSVESA